MGRIDTAAAVDKNDAGLVEETRPAGSKPLRYRRRGRRVGRRRRRTVVVDTADEIVEKIELIRRPADDEQTTDSYQRLDDVSFDLFEGVTAARMDNRSPITSWSRLYRQSVAKTDYY